MNHYTITRDKFFSVKEAKKLLKMCERKASIDVHANRTTWVTRYMLIHLALYSGLRVSEIAALKIGDLHFNGTDNYLIVQSGKGKKKREVYLDKELVKHMQNYLEIKQTYLEESVNVEAPFFAGRGGQHYTTTALEISFKRAIAATGLSMHYSIHSSRHTYATFLLAKTNSLRFAQKQLGGNRHWISRCPQKTYQKKAGLDQCKVKSSAATSKI